MKKLILYFICLGISAVLVFLMTFTLGRRPTLEQELARRTMMERGEESLIIESLKSLEPEVPEEPEEEIAEPEVQNVSEDVTITRVPAEEAGLVLLLDRGLLSADGEYDFFSPRRFFEGLKSFLGRLPASVRIGLRSLSTSTAGDCGGGLQLRSCDLWSVDELTGSCVHRALSTVSGA